MGKAETIVDFPVARTQYILKKMKHKGGEKTC